MSKKDLKKYTLSFKSFLEKLDLLSRLEIPEGYKVIDAKKHSKKKSKNKNSDG